MKKKRCLALAVGGLLVATGALSGCNLGGNVVQSIDKNKTQIYVSVYNGGTGMVWFDRLAEAWNATNSEYEIISQPEKKEMPTIIAEVEMAQTATSPSIYFSVGSTELKVLVEKKELEDLSDLLSVKPDGENGMTIREKLNTTDDYLDLWGNVASNSTSGGLYMLPWNEAITGFVYDHDMFLDPDNNADTDDMWLIKAKNTPEVKAALTAQGIVYKEDNGVLKFVSSESETNYKVDDVILDAGRDGKYGTYDDGQPKNESEWQDMIDKILLSGTRTFIWTKKFQSSYLSFLENTFLAQSAGIQAVIDFYDRDSGGVEYEMYDGTKSAFTIEDGYKSYGMKGIADAVNFAQEYLKNENEIHPAATQDSYDHGDIQGLYLMGYRGVNTNPPAAMLVEGSWWENEARVSFATNAEKNPERGYGKRDYRYMLTPMLDGSKGANGDGTGTAMGTTEISSFFVPKCKDEKKLAAIKDFIAFTLKDENLRAYTRLTGVVRPYVYNLTGEDRAEMTPFARNNWDVYHDTENIKLVKTWLYQCQPIYFATSGFTSFPYRANKVYYDSIVGALDRNSAQKVIEGIATNYTVSEWKKYVDQAREGGYYAD